MLRVRHTGLLLRELAAYTVVNRVWWLLPLVTLLIGLIVLAVVGQATVPYTMYTLF